MKKETPNLAQEPLLSSHEAAQLWLEKGANYSWSLEPRFNCNGDLYFAIYEADFFNKARNLPRDHYCKKARAFVAQPAIKSWLKSIGASQLLNDQIFLSCSAQKSLLPCEFVVKKQIREHELLVPKTQSQKSGLKKVDSDSEKNLAPFEVLICWFDEPLSGVNFFRALQELEPTSITPQGNEQLDVYLRCWQMQQDALNNSRMEMCFLDEIRLLRNALKESRKSFVDLKNEVRFRGKRPRDADQIFAQKSALALSGSRHSLCLNGSEDFKSKAAESDALIFTGESHTDERSSFVILPQLSQTELNSLTQRLIRNLCSPTNEKSTDTLISSSRMTPSMMLLMPVLPYWLAVQVLANIAYEVAKHIPQPDPERRRVAFAGRKNPSSWSCLANALRPAEVFPLMPIIKEEEAFWSPALLHPKFSIQNKSELKKHVLSEETSYVSLPQLLNKSVSFDCWESSAGRLVPFFGEQFLGGILSVISSMPGLFQNFEMMKEGRIHRGQPDETASLRIYDDSKALRCGEYPNTENTPGRNISITTPYIMRPASDFAGLCLDVTKMPVNTKALEIVQFSQSQNVKINVSFQPKNGKEFGLLVQAILKSFSSASANFKAEFKENSDFDFEDVEFEPVFSFDIDGTLITEADWIGAQIDKSGYLLPSGEMVSKSTYERCLEIYHFRQKALVRFGALRIGNLWKAGQFRNDSSSFKLSPEEYLGSLQTNLDGIAIPLESDLVSEFSKRLDQLGAFESRLEIRPYQKQGVAWILSRFALGLGVCLADEMGLGKTVQAVCVLKYLFAKDERENGTKSAARKAKQKVKPRALIVCPKSLALNWARELKEWAPNLKIQCVEGQAIDDSADVIITTYPRLRTRTEEWKKYTWLCTVLDEAHQIKNYSTAQAQAARSLQTTYRLAMTGTPLENHPRELWNLLDWLNEGWMGDLGQFEAYTRLARSGREKVLMLSPIRSMISPILLRRLKNDPSVALALPEKLERTIDITLSNEQKALYEAVVLATLGANSHLSEHSGFSLEASSRYLKAILHTKQICNHPDNFLKGDEDEALVALKAHLPSEMKKRLAKSQNSSANNMERSHKILALLELLEVLRETEQGILVFTQFKKSAEILQEAIQSLGVPSWSKLTYFGSHLSTLQREETVAAFQNACTAYKKAKGEDPSVASPPLLILSLKAGGVGLNLTGASHVIHFDRWWNPAVEAQATDRAHRFGQTNKVTVTHFRALGTIEEGIARMMEAKKSVARDFLDAASAEGINESLRDETGFLRLVDPQGIFSGRNISTAARKLSNAPLTASAKGKI